MGHGGDLIMTAALRAVRETDRRNPIVAYMPRLSDWILGRLDDGSDILKRHPVFAALPGIDTLPPRRKSGLARCIDRIGDLALHIRPVRRRYEMMVLRIASRRAASGRARVVHLDMQMLSYAESQDRYRTIWKTGGHACETIVRQFGATPRGTRPEMHLTPDEQIRAAEMIARRVGTIPFVAVDVGTNREWFGTLRAWPPERWSELIARLRRARPETAVVLVGLKDGPAIPDTIDLRGDTSFREAVAVIARASLFVGTEGGLMHAAAAVGTSGLILWGGLTLPEFAGYPELHRILCNYVACAPCGQHGWCHNDHICMRSISVEAACETALHMLTNARTPPTPQ
jgi:hypothetical protein